MSSEQQNELGLVRLRQAHSRVREIAEQTVQDMTQDAQVLKASAVAGGKINEVALYHGIWVESYPGIRLLLIDNTTVCANVACPMHEVNKGTGNHCTACTRVLCESNGSPTPQHQHTFNEAVTVIEGTLQEGDRTWGVGEIAVFPANTPHQTILTGLAMIHWQPPLPFLQFASVAA